MDKVFAALPDDGVYSSGFAMAEMENGYAILVRATVDKAGTEDKPDPVTLESIKVTKEPDREYWAGQPFNPDGMEITATYSNGTTKTLKDIKQNGDQGVKWTPDGALTTSDTSITITYGGKTTAVTVTVKEPEVDELKVEPSSLTYTAGDYFKPADIKEVTAIYSENIKTETITSGYTITDENQKTVDENYRFMTEGSYTLTVSFGGKDANVAITVNPATVTGISVTPPTKTQYNPGEPFDPAGMTVTAYYSDGSFKPIAAGEYTIVIDDKEVSSSYQFDRVGPHTLKVKYNEMVSTNSVSIWVADQEGYHYDDSSSAYVVTGSDGLQNLYNDLQSNFTTAKITLESPVTLGASWPETITFTGELNGNGNTITMEGDRKQGLFKIIDTNGKVLNVDIEVSGTISGTGYIGGTAGKLRQGTVTGCSVTGGSISSSGSGNSDDVGGVVGQNYNGSVNNCYSTGTVSCGSAGGNAGGVVGYNYSSGTVNDCYSTGTVSCYSAGGRAGGVVGFNDTGGTVNDCYSTGDVSGNGYTGGVVGLNSQNSSVTGCYHADGKVSGGHAGGIVGTNNGSTVTACYSTGAVSGGSSNKYTGGVVGWNYNGGSVTACFSTGAVTGGSGNKYTGGVVGWNGGTVTACYWSGQVNGGKGIGYPESDDNAAPVTGGVTWQTAYEDMKTHTDLWVDKGPNTPPKLNWEN